MEEMFYISAFARELGLDTLGLSTLRFNPYSGLEELIARHPDYHIAPDGNIYSNHCSKHGLKQLRRRILREFHTPGQLFHLIHKGLQNGALSLLPALLPRLPAIVWRMGHRVVKHAKRREHRQIHRLK
jgi:hypothetical protein